MDARAMDESAPTILGLSQRDVLAVLADSDTFGGASLDSSLGSSVSNGLRSPPTGRRFTLKNSLTRSPSIDPPTSSSTASLSAVKARCGTFSPSRAPHELVIPSARRREWTARPAAGRRAPPWGDHRAHREDGTRRVRRILQARSILPAGRQPETVRQTKHGSGRGKPPGQATTSIRDQHERRFQHVSPASCDVVSPPTVIGPPDEPPAGELRLGLILARTDTLSIGIAKISVYPSDSTSTSSSYARTTKPSEPRPRSLDHNDQPTRLLTSQDRCRASSSGTPTAAASPTFAPRTPHTPAATSRPRTTPSAHTRPPADPASG
jgi:hypothetical protein